MAVDERERVPTSSQDSRLSSLDARLRQAEQVEEERRPTVDPQGTVRSAGMRALQSLVGMPFGGAVIGWLLDRLFGTAPWIMLGLMFTGFLGAILDLMRFSKSSRSDVEK